MKKKILEFLEPSLDEKESLWKTATFVFDTNVLLNLYRYSKETRDALLSAIKNIGENIWIPHHVAYEFMRKRYEVIFESQNRYTGLSKEAHAFIDKCVSTLRLNKDDKSIKDLEENMNTWLETQKEHDTLVSSPLDDAILNQVLDLFDNKTGDAFDDDELDCIKKEGVVRYAAKTPPGYKDAIKIDGEHDNNAYGDLVLWKQIIAFAKHNEKDIIFITHDQKEDWWNIISGKTIGPRIELRREFFRESNKQFHMYTMNGFIEQSSKSSGKTPNQRVMNEITDIELSNSSVNFLWSTLNKNELPSDESYQKFFDNFIINTYNYENEYLIKPSHVSAWTDYSDKYNKAKILLGKIQRKKEAISAIEKKYNGKKMSDSARQQVQNTMVNINKMQKRLESILNS